MTACVRLCNGVYLSVYVCDCVTDSTSLHTCVTISIPLCLCVLPGDYVVCYRVYSLFMYLTVLQSLSVYVCDCVTESMLGLRL